MSNELTINDQTIITDDGWGDAAAESAERVLRGTLLKFSDWKWSRGKESVAVADGTRLVALGTAAAWVRWADGRPVEYQLREPGRALPEREDLGDFDKAKWEAGPDGTPRDPWQSTRFVYLVDPATAEAFTFSTSSWGGRNAVSELGDAIQRMRFANPGAVPVIELHAAPMLTKFGRKSRPFFKIVDWRKGGSTDAPLQQIEAKKIEPKSANAFDDAIPW